mmetsp:Transcript_28160/g.56635  ORF Transcript_28160/g.56635 Transcript_28160/m.56635 type:complete len:80 (-) Transcript_28160:8-247(-)
MPISGLKPSESMVLSTLISCALVTDARVSSIAGRKSKQIFVYTKNKLISSAGNSLILQQCYQFGGTRFYSYHHQVVESI